MDILKTNDQIQIKIKMPGGHRKPLFPPNPARVLLGSHTPDCKKLDSKVTEIEYKTEVEENVQNNNVELESFNDVDIDERTEPEVTESEFKTEVEEKVQNDNVKLESFTDVDIDERTEPEVTESKFKTEVEENFPLTHCQVFLLIIWLR